MLSFIGFIQNSNNIISILLCSNSW